MGTTAGGPGEGPVADVIIAIGAVPGSLCPSDPSLQLTTATGWARWDGIAVGTYVVSETVPPGREPTLPISRTVDVRIGETTVITFANRLPPSHVHGKVWYDKDANSAIETGEPGLPNITVTLYEDTNGNGLHESGKLRPRHRMQQAADGSYAFDLVRSGNYVAVVDVADPDLPAGMVPVGSAGKAVTGLTPGETRTVNFGFDDSGRLVGHVWHDSNGSGGTPGVGEAPLWGSRSALTLTRTSMACWMAWTALWRAGT